MNAAVTRSDSADDGNLSLAEAARRFGVSRQRLFYAIENGLLSARTHTRPARRNVQVRADDVRRYLDEAASRAGGRHKCVKPRKARSDRGKARVRFTDSDIGDGANGKAVNA